MVGFITKRHNIVFGTQSGERGDVDNSLVQSWMERVPDLIKEYEPENIFNMDETGLFFRYMFFVFFLIIHKQNS